VVAARPGAVPARGVCDDGGDGLAQRARAPRARRVARRVDAERGACGRDERQDGDADYPARRQPALHRTPRHRRTLSEAAPASNTGFSADLLAEAVDELLQLLGIAERRAVAEADQLGLQGGKATGGLAVLDRVRRQGRLRLVEPRNPRVLV